MAVAFTRVSWWLWGGGKDNHRDPAVSAETAPPTPPPPNSSSDFGPENVRFPPARGAKLRSTPRRASGRKWQSREERRTMDREYDLVLVPPDGGCLSGSESDGSDWSVGWLEPHAAEFQTGGESDGGSFAVLVPCYRRGRGELVESSDDQILGALEFLDGYSSRQASHEKGFLRL